MEAVDPDTRTPSVVVLSQSAMNVVPYLSAIAEIEDVLADMLGADVVPMCPRSGRWAETLRERQRLRRIAGRWSATRPLDFARPARRHDVGVVVVNNLHQLGMLDSIPDWRRQADRWVAYIVEIWPSFAAESESTLHTVASQFDHVFTCINWSVEPLQAASGTPWTFLAHPVDTLAVAFHRHAHRPIDVSNRGRRTAAQHQVLVDWCRTTDRFYEFDTGLPIITDHRVHRAHFVEQCARSKVFVSNFARFDQPELHEGHEEVGLRYVEGLAAGAILIGRHPDRAWLRHVLGDVQGLVDFAPDATEVPPALVELLADPEACDRVHVANRRLALERHDVAHAWTAIADLLGVPVGPGVAARIERLRAAAEAL